MSGIAVIVDAPREAVVRHFNLGEGASGAHHHRQQLVWVLFYNDHIDRAAGLPVPLLPIEVGFVPVSVIVSIFSDIGFS
jgi:hypothetical protein